VASIEFPASPIKNETFVDPNSVTWVCEFAADELAVGARPVWARQLETETFIKADGSVPMVQFLTLTNQSSSGGVPPTLNTDAAAKVYVDEQIIANVVDITGKADKVIAATDGNLANLDASGNLVDSGAKTADFAILTGDQVIATPTALTLDGSGNIILTKGDATTDIVALPTTDITGKLDHTNGTSTGIYETINAVSALEIDISLGNVHTKTISGNSTFTFTGNVAGKGSVHILELTAVGTEVVSFTGATFTTPLAIVAGLNTLVFTNDGTTAYKGYTAS